MTALSNKLHLAAPANPVQPDWFNLELSGWHRFRGVDVKVPGYYRGYPQLHVRKYLLSFNLDRYK